MTRKKEPTSECIQCMGDEMLQVRKGNSELCEIIDILASEYNNRHKPGVTVSDYVKALIEAEKDQSRMRKMIRNIAENHVKLIEDLMAALRFLADSCKNGSSGVTVGGDSLRIDMAQIFHTAIDRLRLLEAFHLGLLQGHQPHNEKDFMAHLWKCGEA